MEMSVQRRRACFFLNNWARKPRGITNVADLVRFAELAPSSCLVKTTKDDHNTLCGCPQQQQHQQHTTQAEERIKSEPRNTRRFTIS